MLQLVLLGFGVWHGLRARSLRSDQGQERLAALDERELRGTYDLYVRDQGRAGIVLLLVPGFFTVVTLASGRPWDAIGWVLTVVALLFALREARLAAPAVRQHLAERGVEPTPREVSERRRRRLQQIGGASAACYGLAILIGVFADESSPWVGVAAGLILLAFVLLIAAAWAGAWRYGDERVDDGA